jgi:alpha-beta hydrolase superfamily lysophospholipase
VLDAWRIYLKYQNAGHNVVIMGHSQGTFMTSRLMQSDFDSSPALRSRLIGALLIGGNVGVPQARWWAAPSRTSRSARARRRPDV